MFIKAGALGTLSNFTLFSVIDDNVDLSKIERINLKHQTMSQWQSIN